MIIHIPVDIAGRFTDQSLNLRVRQPLLSRIVTSEHNLHVLHNPVGQIVASEVGITVLISGMNVQLIGDAPVFNPESAGGEIRRSSPAVNDQRLILSAVGERSSLHLVCQRVVQHSYPFVQRISGFNPVFRHNLGKHLDELRLQLHWSRDMQVVEPAFELLLRHAHDVADECVQYLAARNPGRAALGVYQLLGALVIIHPALDSPQHGSLLADRSLSP